MDEEAQDYLRSLRESGNILVKRESEDQKYLRELREGKLAHNLAIVGGIAGAAVGGNIVGKSSYDHGRISVTRKNPTVDKSLSGQIGSFDTTVTAAVGATAGHIAGTIIEKVASATGHAISKVKAAYHSHKSKHGTEPTEYDLEKAVNQGELSADVEDPSRVKHGQVGKGIVYDPSKKFGDPGYSEAEVPAVKGASYTEAYPSAPVRSSLVNWQKPAVGEKVAGLLCEEDPYGEWNAHMAKVRRNAESGKSQSEVDSARSQHVSPGNNGHNHNGIPQQGPRDSITDYANTGGKKMEELEEDDEGKVPAQPILEQVPAAVGG